MTRASDEEPWEASRPVGALVVVQLALYLAWVLTSGPTSGFLPIASATALGVWLGTLAIVHLVRLRASSMLVPGIAALAAAAAWWGMTVPGILEGPGASRGDGWLARSIMLVPALPPALFGTSHLLAASGGGARRYRRAGWVSVVLSLAPARCGW